MKPTYRSLAHQAGIIRKKHRLSPFEAAWCTLWLQGVPEADIPALAACMTEIKNRRYKTP